MQLLQEYSQFASVLFARIFLGVLFLFQGYDAVFRVKVQRVVETYEDLLSGKRVPKFLVVLGAWYTSVTELVGGMLLILGLFEYLALYLLAINLIVAAIGFALSNPLWDPKHVLPRLILIIFLLAAPADWHTLSLDNLILTKL